MTADKSKSLRLSVNFAKIVNQQVKRMNIETDNSDRESFITLYAHYQLDIYRYVLSLLKNSADAQDVVQETAVVLWKKFHSYETDTSFKAWACRIALYETMNYRRKRANRQRILSEKVMQELTEAYIENDSLLEERRDHLKGCLEKLPEKDTELIKERYSTEGTLGDVAEKIGVTANTLYKRLQRVRKQLYDCINRTMSSEGGV